MEVVRKGVSFKFTDEDILAIRKTRDIINRITENMCYDRDKILINHSFYVAEYLTEDIYPFLNDFTIQLLESNTIEVVK